MTPLKPSSGTRIPDDVRQAVEHRDRLCVGLVVLMPGDCAGAMELDHVRASGGLGMKSRSTADNLVRLCGAHHRVKTENGRVWRPILIDYIEGRL
jgi:5-methylcytosine-specific restriction endonuclease McrA